MHAQPSSPIQAISDSLEDCHRCVLRHLNRNKGGLSNVSLPGIAETVQTIELFQASTHIGVPDLGLSKTYQYVLDHHAATIRPPRGEVGAFVIAIGDDVDNLPNILLDMRMLCKLVADSGTRDQEHLPRGQPLTYRNLIQRRLLLLRKSAGPKYSLYEIRRLATLVFSYGAIYPLRGGEQLSIVVQSLINTTGQHERMPEEAEFLLWALMIGALGSVRK